MKLLCCHFFEAWRRLRPSTALLGEAGVGADLANEFVLSVEEGQFILGGASCGGGPPARVAALVLQLLQGGLEVPTNLVLVLALLVLLYLCLALELRRERSLRRGLAVATHADFTVVVVLLLFDLFELLVATLASS